jgi:hypothetical protein
VTRSAAPALIVALALGTGAFAGQTAASRIGDHVALQLTRIAAAWPGATGAEQVEAAVPVPTDDRTSPISPPPRSRDRASTSRPAPARSAAAAARHPSDATLEIAADRLARLTEKQLRSLSAVDALDADGNTSGASLSGVRALGVGLDDGDVVTSIDGRVTRDVSTALGAAVQAYGSGRDTARATVRRGDRTVPVVVHIPRSASRPKG